MPATVTAKGQITIPKNVRERLGITAGEKVDFKVLDDGNIAIVKAGPPKPSRFEKFRGHAGPGMSTEELMKLLRGDD